MRSCLVFCLSAFAAAAQLLPPNEAGVSNGHVHLLVKDVDAQKKFWTDVMGATPIKVGPLDFMKLPGIFVGIRQADPSGGTKGTVINHIGMLVPDVPRWVAAAKAKGAAIVTAEEVPQAKGEYWFNPGVKTRQAFVMAPEGIKIEISEDPGLTVPLANHHVHFYTPDEIATKAWYVKMLGATPGKRGNFEAADVPGVNLTFSKSDAPLPGIKGRSLDHIGFEIRNLEAFCKKLEGQGVKLDRAFQFIPALGIHIAFFTDPWGVNVELTEGLGKL